MSLFIILPNEIITLIKQHLNAITIQTIFKLNRPLTPFNSGDRIIILHLNKKIYGTIIKLYNNYCKVELLPRVIPIWKKCNYAFWKNHEKNNYSFPYYIPKPIKVLYKNIIKLNNWNDTTILKDGLKRILLYSNDYNLNYNSKSDMFNYIF